MRKVLLAMLAVPTALACEPEGPLTTPPGQVCYPLTDHAAAEYGDDCARQACAPELVVIKTSAASDAFACLSASCAKATESGDVAQSSFVVVRMDRPDVWIQLAFARAVLDEPLTLSSLRKHLQQSEVTTWQVGLFPAASKPLGGYRVSDQPVVLDAFSNGVLTFHVDGQQNGLSYEHNEAAPRLCTIGHLPTICTHALCTYARQDEPGMPIIDVRIAGTAQLSVIVP